MGLEGETSAAASSRGVVAAGMSKGAAIVDFILRLAAIIGTLASAIAMGTTYEILPIATDNNIQYRAEYTDLPSLTFFVIANSIVSGYLVISLLLSVLHIIRSGAKKTRLLLIFFDTSMLTLLTAGASSATAIVYLAHKGDETANWFPVCQDFSYFCQRITGSLVGSFITMVILVLIIFLNATAISKH